jgi:hypothetical protein
MAKKLFLTFYINGCNNKDYAPNPQVACPQGGKFQITKSEIQTTNPKFQSPRGKFQTTSTKFQLLTGNIKIYKANAEMGGMLCGGIETYLPVASHTPLNKFFYRKICSCPPATSAGLAASQGGTA